MLEGITVVDFTRYLPGPYCTMRLADLGAEVLKVEAYPSGDPGRTFGPRAAGVHTIYWSHNRNKRSVLLNLKADEGKKLAFELAARADVVVESYRPGVMRHLGLDYESLSRIRPDLVYCSLTGYGQDGPMHQLGGHDLNYQAVSGVLALNRNAEGRPVVSELLLADYAGGLYAAEQICAALVHRFRTGEGGYLDIASVDVLASWMAMHAAAASCGRAAEVSQFVKGCFHYHVYEAADGRFVALAALEDKFWFNFCRAVGREDWETLESKRIADHPDVYEEMKALFLTRTQAEWNELGMEVDCCLTAVEELDTWLASTYVTSRRLSFVVETGAGRVLPQVRTTPLQGANDFTPPPRLGDDTHAVLKEKLGISGELLDRYVEAGVIPKAGSVESAPRG